MQHGLLEFLEAGVQDQVFNGLGSSLLHLHVEMLCLPLSSLAFVASASPAFNENISQTGLRLT